MDDQLWRWGADELTRAIRTRQISSREAVESCLGRLEQVNPEVNAVVDVLADEALTQADRADKSVGDGEALGPLHGVPITVKINVDYRGRATTNGVVAFHNMIADEDSVPIANLRKAGAVIFGRTNVPGFSTRYFTDNALHGPHHQPLESVTDPGRLQRWRGGSGGNGYRTHRPRQRSCRLGSLSGIRLRGRRTETVGRPRARFQSEHHRRKRPLITTHPCPGSPCPLDPGSPKGLRRLGPKRSA